MEKTIEFWKQNAEEDYIQTPISVLRYITELEKSTEKECLLKRYNSLIKEVELRLRSAIESSEIQSKYIDGKCIRFNIFNDTLEWDELVIKGDVLKKITSYGSEHPIDCKVQTMNLLLFLDIRENVRYLSEHSA